MIALLSVAVMVCGCLYYSMCSIGIDPDSNEPLPVQRRQGSSGEHRHRVRKFQAGIELDFSPPEVVRGPPLAPRDCNVRDGGSVYAAPSDLPFMCRPAYATD